MEPVHLQVTSLSLLSSFRHANQLRSHLWTFVCLKVFENPTTIMKAKEKNRNFRLYFPGGGTEAEERSEISFKVAIPDLSLRNRRYLALLGTNYGLPQHLVRL